VRVRLEDGGACFNLNSVVEGLPGHWLRREGALRQYRALLTALGLGERRALELSEALSDWIDSDSGRSTAGAEDDAYAGYRTSGALLSETSELRAVRGYDAQIYGLVRPYICALPTPEPTMLNVNELALDKAILLTALSDGAISPDAGRRAIAARSKDGWRDVTAFLAEPSLRGVARPPAGQLSVRSRYYELTAQADYAGGEVLMTSLIEQLGDGRTILRARRWTADE
jgi:general secretion pathway protein K